MLTMVKLDVGSLMVTDMASNEEASMSSWEYDKPVRMRKATPPPSPWNLGRLSKSYPDGVKSMSSAAVCLEESQVSESAMASRYRSDRKSERKVE